MSKTVGRHIWYYLALFLLFIGQNSRELFSMRQRYANLENFVSKGFNSALTDFEILLTKNTNTNFGLTLDRGYKTATVAKKFQNYRTTDSNPFNLSNIIVFITLSEVQRW